MESFSADSAVLRFRLRFLEEAVQWRWLLWPVWAWRVVAPRPQARKLNIFQRAALGLCLAGTRRAEDIAARLGIGVDLAAFIVVELGGIGFLDALGAPTERGRRVLEDDESEPTLEQTVGWVFTDPFSGETWPRFHAGELPYAEVEWSHAGRCVLKSGTIGNPRKDDALAVLPRLADALHAAQPRPEDVLRAVRAHRRQHSWEDEPIAEEAPPVQRVSFVSEDPVACLLAARAWRAAAGEWRTDDPFGIGESLRLRRWIEERLDARPDLRRWLGPVAGGDAEAPDLASLAQRAAWEVEERLTIAVRQRPVLRERLVAMQRALLETALDGCPDDKWDDVALKAQRAAERLFLEVCEAHPARSRLTQDPACNEALLAELAAAAGFDAPLPPTLLRVKSGKVVHAAREGSGSLRPLILLALLGTAGSPEHPLARAARVEPRLLHHLDALAGTRDRAAHEASPDGRGSLQDRRRSAREGVELVLSAVKLLILS